MKWLSVKKYKPPTEEVPVFVRYTNKDYVDLEYHRCGLGRYRDGNSMPLTEFGYEITHFCIPDPIEVEESP